MVWRLSGQRCRGFQTPPLVRMFLASLLALPIACSNQPLEILGPTPGDEGITFYLHAGFAGPSQAVNHDVGNLSKVEGPCSSGAEGETPTWSRCVSSVRVAPGWTATLYRDSEFRGRSVTLTSDAPNLKELPGPCEGTFNDCVMSMKVARQ
jgi:hypothetical protein